MLTSSRRGLSYPNPATRSDSADVPRDIQTVINALELDVVFGQGTHAARPAPGAGAPAGTGGGRLYWETDTLTLWYDTGSAWINMTPTVTPGPGSITTAMLASSVPIVPVGSVIDWPWASGDMPSWSMPPVAQALTKTSYPVLAAIAGNGGYIYGGSTPNPVFNLPDYRGRVTAGLDNMGGVIAGRITLGVSGTSGGLGAIAGVEGVVLTTAQIPAHNHTFPNGNTTVQPNVTGAPGGYGGGFVPDQQNTNSTGGGGVHINVQPTLFVNKLMRVF